MFSGTYDGGGREVRNMSFDQTGKNSVGMFGVVYGATIENLTLQVRIRSDGYSIGGLIGIVYGEGVTVRDVRADVDIVAQDGNAGGLIGEGDGSMLLERSRVTGSLSVQGTFYAGGLVGNYYGSAPAELVIIDSVSSAAISSSSSTMSLGGVLGGTFGPTRISDTIFDGSLSGAGSDRYSGWPAGSIDPPVPTTGVGGVIGSIDWTGAVVVVSDVRVEASGLTGVEAVGGVVGQLSRVDTLSIERTIVRAPVNASLEFGGCLIGWFADGTAEKVTTARSFSRSTTNVAGETTQCPFPPDPVPASPSFVAPGGVIPSQTAGSGAWVQADGSSVPLVVSSPGVNQVGVPPVE